MTEHTQTVEQLLTYKEAGAWLGVTDRTVFSIVKTGKLPAVRFGRSVRIDPVDLRAFIDQSKSSPRRSGKKGRP